MPKLRHRATRKRQKGVHRSIRGGDEGGPRPPLKRQDSFHNKEERERNEDKSVAAAAKKERRAAQDAKDTAHAQAAAAKSMGRRWRVPTDAEYTLANMMAKRGVIGGTKRKSIRHRRRKTRTSKRRKGSRRARRRTTKK